MHGVAQHTHDFRRENTLQNFDGLARITFVGRSDGALVEMLPRTLSQRLYVRKERRLGIGDLGFSIDGAPR